MNYPQLGGLQAYQKNKYETASPHRLILMLYEAALVQLDRAERAIEQRDIAERNRTLQKAQDILVELVSSLNMQQGGEIARNLRQLYLYMIDRLTQANIKSDIEAIREVRGLLQPIKSAWEQIGKDVRLESS